MAAINFPTSPTELDTFTHEGRTWLYTGGVWISQTAAVSPGEGDVMSPGVSVVSGNLVVFDGTTGTAIEDSGIAAANVVVDSDLGNSASRNVGTTAGTVAAGDDSRLSDARTPTSHVHGNITNAGAIGSTSGLPVKTGTSGVLEAGAFGASAGQFAEGNHSHDLSTEFTGTLPVVRGGTGITSLGTGVATFLGAPSSANLAAAITDETGTGAAVFGTAPALSNPTITNYVETVYAPSAGTAFTVDLANGTVQKLTSSGNLTVTLPSSVSGKSFIIIVAYGGTHTLTWAGATIKWNGGTAPTATSVSGKFDIFTFFQDGTNTYGSVFGQNF